MSKYIVQINYFIDEEFFIFNNKKYLIKFLKKINKQYPTAKIQIFKSIETEMSDFYV